MRPQSPVSEVVFQQTVTVIPPDALHTIPSAPLSAQLTAKVSSKPALLTCHVLSAEFPLEKNGTGPIDRQTVVERVLKKHTQVKLHSEKCSE